MISNYVSISPYFVKDVYHHSLILKYDITKSNYDQNDKDHNCKCTYCGCHHKPV